MIVFLILIFYPVIIAFGCIVLNAKALLPGTANYRRDQMARQAVFDVERTRTEAIQARYRRKENDELDMIQTRQLEAAK